MIDRLYEHLITKKKYNTLENKYETLRTELERKCYELTLERKIKEKQVDLYNKRLEEILQENIKLKEQVIKLKKNIKGVQNGKK